MVYLDYSATSPVDEKVLESFNKTVKYIGNPNSLHKLGQEAKHLIDLSTEQITQILNLKDKEIIYTSGATESNNTVIKAMEFYQNRGEKIITTKLEHSSIYAPLKYLEEKGFEIIYAPLINGIVDINALEIMLKDVTLVSISMVNSETGIRQPIEQIAEMLKKYPKTYFHTDITQAIGKIKFDLKDVDFASFSAHKFFGLKGVGGLIKNKNINIVPLISGGKSTTNYRSGTPATPLIVSTAKALRLVYENLEEEKIKYLNEKIKENIQKYPNVIINSTQNSIPHILNFSVLNIKPETFMHSLEKDEVYISTQSACAKGNYSEAVLALTNNKEISSHSLRISISKKTTEEEIDIFLKAFERSIKELSWKNY